MKKYITKENFKYMILVLILISFSGCTTYQLSQLEKSVGIRNGSATKKLYKEKKEARERLKQAQKEEIDKFLNRYNINSNYRVKLSSRTWSPMKKSQSLDFLSGYGYLTLRSKSNSIIDAVQVYGNFNKGKLVSTPRVEIYGSNCLKFGILYCKNEVKDVYKKDTNSKNLSYTIKKGIDQVIKNVKRKSNSARRNRNISNSYSSSASNTPNYTSCNWQTGKSCHKIIKKLSSTTYKIECTRGFKIGQTNKVCVNSKGKWASGCGLSDAFAYHNDSLSIAANKWCD